MSVWVLNDLNVMTSYCTIHIFNKMSDARWDLCEIFVCVGSSNPDKAPRSSLQPGEALSLLPALKAAKNCLSDSWQSPNQVVNYWNVFMEITCLLTCWKNMLWAQAACVRRNNFAQKSPFKWMKVILIRSETREAF